jgi:predicted NBD/HSP70 family sugar kinase
MSGNSNGSTQTNFGQLIDLALQDEDAAQNALRETAYYLGVGIANLIEGLAPEAVIVGGPIVRAWPVLSQEIKSAVETTICRGLPSTKIIASTLGPEPTLMGAVSLVLASKFASVSVT